MQALFGTSGIRGVVDKDYYPDFYLHMGLVFGTVLKSKQMAVAGDGRTTMPILKNALISGLTATGHDVSDIGVLPTPALQYYCKNKRIPGIMVTASHNPAEYNGFKLVLSNGTDIYGREKDEVEKLYFKHNFAENSPGKKTDIKYATYDKAGRVSYDAAGRDLYVNGIARLADLATIKRAKLRVLYDCVNGSTTQTAPFILKKLGLEPVPINEKLDGTFPGHPPEPTEANIMSTIKAIREKNVDFGIVFDSDGDRSVFLSPDGRYIDGNFSIPIIAKLKLRKGDSLVVPVDTADTVPIVAEEMGLKLYLTKIGRQHVVREMMNKRAKLGGEENGGIIYAPHQYCGDGGMALALFAEAVAKQKLDELLDSVPSVSFMRDKVYTNVEFEGIRRKMLRHAHTDTDEMDGLKMRLSKDSWVMVRKSGTEPVYRIYAQAGSREGVERLVSSYRRELFGR